MVRPGVLPGPTGDDAEAAVRIVPEFSLDKGAALVSPDSSVGMVMFGFRHPTRQTSKPALPDSRRPRRWRTCCQVPTFEFIAYNGECVNRHPGELPGRDRRGARLPLFLW